MLVGPWGWIAYVDATDPGTTTGAVVLAIVGGLFVVVVLGMLRWGRGLISSSFRAIQRVPKPLASPSARLLSTQDFIGRAAELAVMRELLADESVRVIALVGPTQLGKSYLASEAVRRARRRMGVPFVRNFRNPTTVDVLLSALIRHLEVGVTTVQFAQLDLTERINLVVARCAASRRILVFDNFESVLDSKGRIKDSQLRQLMTRACHEDHKSVVVLTSRVPLSDLGGAGYRQPELFGLAGEEARSLLRAAGLSGSEDGDLDEIARRFAGRRHSVPIRGRERPPAGVAADRGGAGG